MLPRPRLRLALLAFFGLTLTVLAAPPAKPILLEEFTLNYSIHKNVQDAPHSLYGTLKLKNVSPSALEGIRVSIQMRDGNNQPLPGTSAMVAHEVGVLYPGQSATWEWDWQNYSAVPLFQPLAVITGRTASGEEFEVSEAYKIPDPVEKPPGY